MRGRTFTIALMGSILAGVALGQLQRGSARPDTLHQHRAGADVRGEAIANAPQPAPLAIGGLDVASEALPARSIHKQLPAPAFGTELLPAFASDSVVADTAPPTIQLSKVHSKAEPLNNLQPVLSEVPMNALPVEAKEQSELVIVRASQVRPKRTIDELEAGTRGNKVSISLPPSQNSGKDGRPAN